MPNLDGFTEEFAHPLRRANRFLNLAEQLGRLSHRTGHEGRVKHEAGQLARTDVAAAQSTIPMPPKSAMMKKATKNARQRAALRAAESTRALAS